MHSLYKWREVGRGKAARAYKLLPKLLNPVMKLVKGAVAADMDAVMAHCEGKPDWS